MVPTAAWQSVLLSYNLMSATIPSLKGFTQGFMTAGVSLGYARDTTTVGASGSHHTYEMRSLSKSKSRAAVSPQESAESQLHVTSVQRNPNRKSTKTTITPRGETQCQHEESASIASHDSQQIMIKREWNVQTT